MPTVTDILDLLRLESEGGLTRVARFYNQSGKIISEYKTIPKPTKDLTECLKRTFIYNLSNEIVGEQVRVNVWTTFLDGIVSPSISDILLSANSIASGLSAGIKIADISILGGVFPFQISLSSNPGNLFRIDNGTELTLNSPSSPGSYPIQIQVLDDDEKVESKNFTINVPSFSNTKSTQLDGIDERVDFGTNINFRFDRADSYSVSGWFKAGVSAVTMHIFGTQSIGGTPRGWSVKLDATKAVIAVLSNSSTNQIAIKTNTLFVDGLWHNFVITYNGSSLASGLKIYVDGSLQAVTVMGDNLTLTTVTSNNLRAGCSTDAAPSQFYSGNLDELAIWNKELNVSEIASIYNSGMPSNLSEHVAMANLLHWYRMGDDDIFPTIQDKIGLNNGSCINMESIDIQGNSP